MRTFGAAEQTDYYRATHSDPEKKSPQELYSRLVKVITLENFLLAHGYTSGHAEKMNELNWRQIAELAGVRPPKEETQAQVIEWMRKFEEWKE